jgi:putative FmdB family regulatory protein
MPTYSYGCEKCNQNFELFYSIKDYQSAPLCINCGNKKTHRLYALDVSTQSSCVKKSDSELKTIGDLANRNRDRLSDDQKQALSTKHNRYKEEVPQKQLPKGMTRIKKQPKTKWT